MKYCVIEFTDDGDNMVIGRTFGPYSLRDGMKAAKRLAKEAAEDMSDMEAKELDALDHQEVTGDSAGTFGVVESGENYSTTHLYAVRELSSV